MRRVDRTDVEEPQLTQLGSFSVPDCVSWMQHDNLLKFLSMCRLIAMLCEGLFMIRWCGFDDGNVLRWKFEHEVQSGNGHCEKDMLFVECHGFVQSFCKSTMQKSEHFLFLRLTLECHSIVTESEWQTSHCSGPLLSGFSGVGDHFVGEVTSNVCPHIMEQVVLSMMTPPEH